MGKKKKTMKPFCWYCERTFDDEKILIQHQKAKHFKCNVCHKKLTTAGGMAIHVYQVHKQTLTAVPNALPSKDSLQYEILGMDGIPDDKELGPDAKRQKSEKELTMPYIPGSGIIPGQIQGVAGMPELISKKQIFHLGLFRMY